MSDGRSNNDRFQSHQLHRAGQRSTDAQDKWEHDIMIRSGVLRGKINTESFNESAERARLQIHNIKPEFLEGRVSFSKQTKQVLTVRDPTSDIAVLSKKGSALCASRRLQRDRNKMRKRFWELHSSSVHQPIPLPLPVATKQPPAPL